ncbi:hypothetical protein WMY93_020944 [Mugilogobius chulae]|uniref:Uncharacterized protein n=1 Tax=Mugilogobius chulae TaxID=88201 RepID=A0AAW0NDU3_9GOBI
MSLGVPVACMVSWFIQVLAPLSYLGQQDNGATCNSSFSELCSRCEKVGTPPQPDLQSGLKLCSCRHSVSEDAMLKHEEESTKGYVSDLDRLPAELRHIRTALFESVGGAKEQETGYWSSHIKNIKRGSLLFRTCCSVAFFTTFCCLNFFLLGVAVCSCGEKVRQLQLSVCLCHTSTISLRLHALLTSASKGVIIKNSFNMSDIWDDLDLLLDSPSSLTITSNTRGTVKDSPSFKVDEDVAALRKAIEGLGTTEKH